MTLSNKKIIQEVIDCSSSKENACDVVNWLSSTIEGHQTLSDMIDHDAYVIEDYMLDNNPIDPTQSAELLEKIDTQIRNNRFRLLTLRIAAVFLPLIIILGFGIYVNNHFNIIGKTTYTEINIPNGEKAHIIFQDGSEAILNSSSKIVFPNKFGITKREIQLEGEAYFKIDKNKHRPFIVKTDKADIKVLGTSFNVSAYKEDEFINVTLDEGIIVFNTPNNKHQLSPGQQLIFNKDRNESFMRFLKKPENSSLWMSDKLFFDDTPLRQAIKILERKFDVKFEIKDNKAVDYSFTIITDERDIDDVLKELEMIAPIRFNLQNDIYEITLS